MAPPDTVVGFIGLGAMGMPMARRLLAAGFPVVAFNRSRPPLEELAGEGVAPCASAGEVGERAEIVLTALPTEDAVREVADELLAVAHQGQVLVEHSTVSPGLCRDLAARAASLGVGYLDAPVSGGPAGAEAGTLTVMAGGDGAVLARAAPVLAAFGDPVRHCGEIGSGQALKLVNQLLVAVHTAASAEAAAFAAALGVRLDLVREVVGSSFGGSVMLSRNLPRIAAADFAPATPVQLILKDLEIIWREASSGQVPLQMGARARELFGEAADRGLNGDDMAALSRLWDGLEETAGAQ